LKIIKLIKIVRILIIRNLIIQTKISKKVSEKLEKLNHLLINIESKTFSQYKIIEKNCKNLKAKNDIDDFEIEIILECWNKVSSDKPFFKTSCNFINLQESEKYFLYDFNDTNKKELKFNKKHCYSFHHLYDHTSLTFLEISEIEKFWFEIKVSYQFTFQL
jgi:hypothetical protein